VVLQDQRQLAEKAIDGLKKFLKNKKLSRRDSEIKMAKHNFAFL
jgi:hypothetical protein